VVDTEEAAVAAVHQVAQVFDRRACRRAFEERFTVERMAQDYLRLYREVNARAGAVEGSLAGY
jgi:glycosyltransferase involved in cell wall biosynthesis